jgi:hypothetical protein
MFLDERDQLPAIVRPVTSTAATRLELYFISSVHDAYGRDDTQGRFMFERLGGTQIISPTRPSSYSTG